MMTTYGTTRQDDGSVRYWDVYRQQWEVAYAQDQVSDEVSASLSATDREMIATLPEHDDA